MNIESPGIPYNFSDLEPALSRDTLVFHSLRHQRGCFDRMLAMIRGTDFETMPLEELIRVTERTPRQHAIYRCAAEVWNHSVFWHSMRPHGGGAATGLVGERLRAHYGSHERFARRFKDAAAAQFGSGWLWLVWRHDAPEIVSTRNAGTPLVRGDTVLLALDLWEHAYYLDYQNRRGAYVSAFLDELVNWDFANRRLAEALAATETREATRSRAVAEAHLPTAVVTMQ